MCMLFFVDRVEFCQLSNTLLNKGMNSVFVRCLHYMYKNEDWNGIPPTVNVLLLQMGWSKAACCHLFYLEYILINKLRDSGFGCTVGSHYVGCLAYADDIVFLSPTKIGLHEMLKICQEYSSEYFLTFNAQKSQYIVFNQSVAKDNHGILIGHQFLPRQNHVLHLGRPQDYWFGYYYW